MFNCLFRITAKRIPTDRPNECNPDKPFFTKKRKLVCNSFNLLTV